MNLFYLMPKESPGVVPEEKATAYAMTLIKMFESELGRVLINDFPVYSRLKGVLIPPELFYLMAQKMGFDCINGDTVEIGAYQVRDTINLWLSISSRLPKGLRPSEDEWNYVAKLGDLYTNFILEITNHG